MSTRLAPFSVSPIEEALEQELLLRLAVERAYQQARTEVFDVEAHPPTAPRTPRQLDVISCLDAAEASLRAFRWNRGGVVPGPRTHA